jgi:MoxR-like ATPase
METNEFIKSMIEDAGGISRLRRAHIIKYAEKQGMDYRDLCKKVLRPEYKSAQRGFYDYSKYDQPQSHQVNLAKPKFTPIVKNAEKVQTVNMVTTMNQQTEDSTYIPSINSGYIRWGSFNDVEKIIKSNQFFPIYISGPSGNGKTMMVEQACAKVGRKFIRVNLSPETDEDDLIGGFRLQNGDTVFAKGPVIRAMEDGAVLLLDEVDRATNKIMCLQSVLEGNSVLLKKTGETVYPAPGFTIIATANTSGRGSEDGKYNSASILDDAFLERFPIMINQPWPSKAIEKKIVLSSMTNYDCVDEDFAEKLVTWAKIIRATYEADGVEDVVSTRRLDHVVKTFGIFGNRIKSIELAVNRFAKETSEAFIDLYTKIDAGELSDSPEITTDPQSIVNTPSTI